MADNDTHGPAERRRGPGDDVDVQPDGGVATGREPADYLDERINLFRPATPFMRDHLKLIWGTFAAWLVVVFGPVTVAAIAPEAADAHRVAGTPTLFMVTAIGTPLGALLLSVFYAWSRDRLVKKYDVEHGRAATDGTDEGAATAADGGTAATASEASTPPADGGDGR